MFASVPSAIRILPSIFRGSLVMYIRNDMAAVKNKLGDMGKHRA